MIFDCDIALHVKVVIYECACAVTSFDEITYKFNLHLCKTRHSGHDPQCTRNI